MMKISRGYMENERKKAIYIIIAAVFFVVLSANIHNSIKSYKYRKLCNELREQLTAAEATNRELTETIEECQSITGSIGELCNRNISSSRDIIESVEQIRTQVYELEDCLGSFNQSEYYEHWDSYFRDEGLIE